MSVRDASGLPHGSRPREVAGLVVGLDGLALLREARRAQEPDPAAAAMIAELAGANGISIGLRTDRKHVQERDAKVLRATVKTRLQVRIGPTPESVKIVVPIRPDLVVLVPERGDTLAFESGFDLTLAPAGLPETAHALREAGLDVLALVDPEVDNVKAAHRIGLSGVSIIGARLGAARLPDTEARELEALERCVRMAAKLGLLAQVAHGLDLRSVASLSRLPGLAAVEVGHALVARAALVGMDRAVRDFKEPLGA